MGNGSSIELKTANETHVLELTSKGLTAIPRGAKKLTGLTSLDMTNNRISEVPDFVWTRFGPSLTKVNFSHNVFKKLDGPFAATFTLTSLDVSGNLLDTVTPKLANLVNLRRLVLALNDLTQLPPALFENMARLTQLDLSQNALTSLPALGGLVDLVDLNLSRNKLRILKDDITSLRRLELLAVDHNSLETLPSGLSSLTLLTRLFLSENRLEILPGQLNFMQHLHTLDVGFNSISRLPPEINQLHSLQELIVRGNPLHWSDQPVCATLRKLDAVDTNCMTLPDLSEADELVLVELSQNYLMTIGPEIGTLTNLTILNLYFNNLHSIDDSIGLLQNLQWCNLSYNLLSHLPPSLFTLPSLRDLLLGYNRLTELPSDIRYATCLESLHLAGNEFVELPNSLCKLHNLQALYIGMNKLVSLPSHLGDLRQLKKLDAMVNALSDLPASIGHLQQLTELDISHNNFTQFPIALTSMQMLELLSVRYNAITSLPPQLAQVRSLQVINVEGNPLGRNGVPQSLQSRAKLLLCKHDDLNRAEVGISEIIGRRPYMQDATAIDSFTTPAGDPCKVYAIYDGHHGRAAADFMAHRFVEIVERKMAEAPKDTMKDQLEAAFKEAEQTLSTEQDGTTAAVVVVAPTVTWFSNVGDTRIVLRLTRAGIDAGIKTEIDSRRSEQMGHHAIARAKPNVVRVSTDHNPLKEPDELKRVKNLGGFVTRDGYINDMIGLSRSLGDAYHRPYVMGEPYTVLVNNAHYDKIVLATDGVWDIMTEEMAIDLALTEQSPVMAAVKLRDAAYLAGSGDNISVFVLGTASNPTPRAAESWRYHNDNIPQVLAASTGSAIVPLDFVLPTRSSMSAPPPKAGSRHRHHRSSGKTKEKQKEKDKGKSRHRHRHHSSGKGKDKGKQEATASTEEIDSSGEQERRSSLRAAPPVVVIPDEHEHEHLRVPAQPTPKVRVPSADYSYAMSDEEAMTPIPAKPTLGREQREVTRGTPASAARPPPAPVSAAVVAPVTPVVKVAAATAPAPSPKPNGAAAAARPASPNSDDLLSDSEEFSFSD